MNYCNRLASVLILISACGDDGSTTMTSTTANTMTTVTTASTSPTNPSSATMGDDTSATEGPTTGSASGATEGPTTGTTDTPPTSTTNPVEGAPIFLSFNTNVGKITEGESVTFTALLTDPDGVDDIVGGSLLSEDEKIDFGPLIAAGQPGTYSISLSWAQIHQSEPIAFEDAEPPRVFRARFFDQQANQVVKDAEILLTCAGGSACDGSCTDLGVDGVNCGTCGHSCASMGCEGGSCTPNLSGCFKAADGLDTCAAICTSLGEACAESQCKGFTVEKYASNSDCLDNSGGPILLNEPCDMMQAWVKPAIKCCCTDSN